MNWLFGNKEQEKVLVEKTQECTDIQEMRDFSKQLLIKDHYVARSEYLDVLPKYQKTVEYFSVLRNSGMLKSFCEKNQIDCNMILDSIDIFKNIVDKVGQANEEYVAESLIKEKDYLDNILKKVDPVISLDEDQRKVILTDEDYSLVIAGAGAGKTTTVAAKVKYLVEKKNIDTKDILVISFTNKAVGELKEKINKDLGIDCPIATFHATGNAILHINNTEQLNIVEGSKLYFLLQDYFRTSLLTNESLVNNLIMFFASYFDAPYEGSDLNAFFNKTAKANYTTMRSDLDEFKKEIVDSRTKKLVTIQNEVLRSYQEVEIANFLYLNSLDYEYESMYPYNIAYSRKPYTPDFMVQQGDKIIYIEHFGITEDGKNNRYSEEELSRYRKWINHKIMLHKEHGTHLIYTFSGYKDGKSITSHLKEKLEEAGFELHQRPAKEIMEKLIVSEESKYIRKLVNLICRFIVNFKTNGYTADEFSKMYHSTTNVRSKLFLNICEECFLQYEKYLKENKAVDFEDMINESAKILRDVKEMRQRLHFKYIIVDEYQDISRQRFDLTKALSEVTDGKIIAVGDDWQSIYAFSGSDISLFTKFEEKMGYAKLLKIVRTYRNSQDVIDIAGNFIQRNPEQIEKKLISPKRIKDPVIIYTYDNTVKKYDESRRLKVQYATAKAVETALEQIIEFNKMEGKGDNGSILLLGRYGFDGDHLERSGLFEYNTRGSKIKSVKYPKLNITFMTVHMAKGLGYDNVIVVNGKNETYGFPSKIEDDPVLSFVIKGDNAIDYAEERRLFYVAMTRTKNRVYFIAPEKNPSEFLLEIKRNYKNVVLKGSWNEDDIHYRMDRKICPVCGYPLQLRYKNAYGLRLYICTNEPEICGFMTNEIKAGKLAIMKCDKCRDGYLIAKSANRTDFFLGCTNYKKDKTGCNNTISSIEYDAMMGFTQDAASTVQNNKGIVKKINPNTKRNEQKTQKITPQQSISAREIVSFEQDIAIMPEEAEVFSKTLQGNNMYQGYDLEKAVHDILKCLDHISVKRFYGVTFLVSILKGADEKRMERDNLKSVAEYGMYADMSHDDIRTIVQWLIDNHYMFRTTEKYPTLHLTYEGNHVRENLSQEQLLRLKKYLEGSDRGVREEKNRGGYSYD